MWTRARAYGAWSWQANAYEKQLSDSEAEYERQLATKDRDHGRERAEAATAAIDALAEQQDARRALEARLQDQSKAHFKELNDAQQSQARLRDRLATADLRLSILVDANASEGRNGGVRQAAGTGGVVYGTVRAELDPAHAQRIIGITNDGDKGLIALKACQAYVRNITH